MSYRNLVTKNPAMAISAIGGKAGIGFLPSLKNNIKVKSNPKNEKPAMRNALLKEFTDTEEASISGKAMSPPPRSIKSFPGATSLIFAVNADNFLGEITANIALKSSMALANLIICFVL